MGNLTGVVQDEIIFFGHKNVLSRHTRTLEVTKDQTLTLRGDCIIGIRADKACSDLDQILKKRLCQEGSFVRIDLIVGSNQITLSGRGSDKLILESSHDIVLRKSNFICMRTASIHCNMASSDIPRNIVCELQNPETRGILRMTAE